MNRVYNNDNLKIPDKIGFIKIVDLSHEMVERLERAKPHNFSQVRKIPGFQLLHVSSFSSFI